VCKKASVLHRPEPSDMFVVAADHKRSMGIITDARAHHLRSGWTTGHDEGGISRSAPGPSTSESHGPHRSGYTLGSALFDF
jgi:hypothetical protein